MEKQQVNDPEGLRAQIKRGPVKAGAAALLACALATGGMLAYFTGTDTVVNEFKISEGLANKVEVVEPSWDETDADGDGVPDAAQNLVPLQTVAKDPAVRNGSDIPAWCYIELKVPTAEVSVLAEDGTPGAAETRELFTYTVNEGWTEFKAPTVADGYTTHLYVADDPVAAGATTGALFDSVTLVNLVEAQGTSGADEITVTAHAIQAEGIEGNGEDAWDFYKAQNAPKAEEPGA